MYLGILFRSLWPYAVLWWRGFVCIMWNGCRYDDGEPEEQVPESRMKAIDLSPLAVGTPVEANFRSSGNYFPGKISAARPDGKYDVVYDDNDTEEGIKRSYLRVLGGKPETAATVAGPGAADAPGGDGLSEDKRERLLQVCMSSRHAHLHFFDLLESQISSPVQSTNTLWVAGVGP